MVRTERATGENVIPPLSSRGGVRESGADILTRLVLEGASICPTGEYRDLKFSGYPE
jgi:hypothetical protein